MSGGLRAGILPWPASLDRLRKDPGPPPCVTTFEHLGLVARSCSSWHDWLMDATVVLGQQGRLVIPAELRAELGLAPGDRLHLQLAGRRLVVQRPQDAVEQLRGLAAKVPSARSLVAELLAERRAAAAAE